jgi:hypothetical protein
MMRELLVDVSEMERYCMCGWVDGGDERKLVQAEEEVPTNAS